MALHLIPYLEDFRSAAAVLERLNTGGDLLICDMSSRWDGRPAGLADLRAEGYKQINVRFSKKTKVVVVDISGEVARKAK